MDTALATQYRVPLSKKQITLAFLQGKGDSQGGFPPLSRKIFVTDHQKPVKRKRRKLVARTSKYQ